MAAAPSGRRVAITGLGVVGPCGIGKDDFWDGLIGPAPDGERRVQDWDPSPYFENKKESRRADRFTQFAIAAAIEAAEQAGELGVDPARIGTLIGTGTGGIGSMEREIVVQHEKGSRRVSPFLVPMMMSNAAAAAVSMRMGFQGPCEATVTACAAGTHSIGNAMRMVADGRCDVVFAGGSESSFTPTALAGFGNMTALSTTGISVPFDARRDGFMMGEGAAVLVLEEWDRAVERGAPIIGEMLGAASTADAHHITAPAPGGSGAVRSMELAMEHAGLSARQIKHINAHGTSTPKNDEAETHAMAKIFGEDGPIVTSTKGITGHALGAAGALEAAAVLLSIQNRLVPPTAGTTELDPDLPKIDLVLGEPRPWEPGPSMSNSFGFGGHNGTIIIGPGK